MAYATLAKVHERLNIADSVTASDTKIASYMSEADGFIDRQFGIHTTVPVASDNELNGLANGLAAAIYVYWTDSSHPLDGLREYKKQISEHIKVRYGQKNIDGLSANSFVKTTSAITGTE